MREVSRSCCVFFFLFVFLCGLWYCSFFFFFCFKGIPMAFFVFVFVDCSGDLWILSMVSIWISSFCGYVLATIWNIS